MLAALRQTRAGRGLEIGKRDEQDSKESLRHVIPAADGLFWRMSHSIF